MHIFDVRKTIRSGNHARWTMLFPHFTSNFRTEIVLHGGDATLLRKLAYIRWFNPQDPVAMVLEILEQRAIIGANVDHQVRGLKSEHFAGLAVQFRKILAQNARGPPGLGIPGRENDLRIYRKTQLYQFTL